MDVLHRDLEHRAQIARRVSADHAGDARLRAALDPHRQVADLQRAQASWPFCACPFPSCALLVAVERIAHEVLDRRQHAGHHVRILHRGVRRGSVLQQQAGLAMDQEHLLHAVEHRVDEDHFGERLARAQRFEPPLHGARRDRVLDGLVDRLDHAAQGFADGLADRGPDHGEQQLGESLGCRLTDRPMSSSTTGSIASAICRPVRLLCSTACGSTGATSSASTRPRRSISCLT